MISRSRRKSLLLALLLGLAFMVLSYARIVGDSQSAGFREEVLDTIFGGSIMGTRLMWNMVWFVVALTFLHLVYGALCWAVGMLSASLQPKSDAAAQAKHERQHVVLWFAFLTIGLLTYNSAVFSRSSLGSPYAKVMGFSVAGIALGKLIGAMILLAVAYVVVTALARRWRAGWRPYTNPRRFVIGAASVAVLCGITAWSTANRSHNDAAKVNVVLIGIDSLRYDIVSKSGPPQVGPHMREFLQGSVWFTDAMTPLARTFPSVTSILTGRQPHKTNAYMNLPPRDYIREGDTLGRIFARAGYHSVFAMDETRFANFDRSYGFDQVVTPTPGATEFLMSLFADTPVSNSVINTRIGKWLFPHIHSNRGAAGVYDPDSFVTRVRREVDFSRPLFLTAHLTLSHWPYVWAGAPLPGPKVETTWPDYYVNVIQRVDQQFADIMDILRARGVLDNAVVVLYSDHGESFGHHHESLVPDGDNLVWTLRAVPQWGHGSTVLTSHQYKVVLGMRAFGAAAGLLPGPREISAPTSVMDIAPTLTKMMALETDQPFDGHSLLPLMADNSPLPAEFTHRVRFTETEYNPVGVATPDGKLNASGIAKAAEMYEIDPVTDRIRVRREHLQPMLTIRQYAAIGDEYMVVAVPFRSEGLSHHFLTLPKDGGTPQLLTAAPDATAPEDLRRVWNAMQTNFAGVIPSAERLSEVVAKSTVAASGRPVTPSVTK